MHIDSRQYPWQTGPMPTTTSLPLADACCVPLLGPSPLAEVDAAALAAAFKVLADPGRLRLLSLIGAQPGAEACTCDLIEPLGLSQPTVSHHLKALREAGFLERERRGQWVLYRLRADRLAAVRAVLEVPVR
jgi:ArsR family transcriptional regulator